MGRYINLFTDFGFKKIFGSEENKDILLDFLNTLLAGTQNLVSLTYLNTERLGKRSTERKAIFDLYCENDKGEKFTLLFRICNEKANCEGFAIRPLNHRTHSQKL